MKPGDFLLGVMDFFAILLPGSMATWLVMSHVDRLQLLKFLGIGGAPDVTTYWVLFLFTSYFLGQFVFMLGSELDRLYDIWREGKPDEDNHTYEAARKLRDRMTGELKGDGFTLLKWCRAYVQIQAPGARVEIDRLEADSKFFRAMVIMAPLFGVHFLFCTWEPVVGTFCLLLVFPAIVRFFQQRWKMTELSYGTAVILAAIKSTAASDSPSAEGGKAA
jgi:hypothetical protein